MLGAVFTNSKQHLILFLFQLARRDAEAGVRHLQEENHTLRGRLEDWYVTTMFYSH